MNPSEADLGLCWRLRAHAIVQEVALACIGSWDAEGGESEPAGAAECIPKHAAQFIAALPASCQTLVLTEFLIGPALKVPATSPALMSATCTA